MFGARTWRSWQDIRKDELRIFSTLDIKKIRRFVRKNDWYYTNLSDDFRLMRMVCLMLILYYPYEADIHVLIWAAIWLSSNGCRVPRGK